MVDTCATCFFAANQTVTTDGASQTALTCRRNAPSIALPAGEFPSWPQRAAWPNVEAGDWCGDFGTDYNRLGLNWKSWVPTIAPGAGAFTTITTNTALYLQEESLILFYFAMTIVTNGTAATNITFTIPVSEDATVNYAFTGLKSGGQALTGIISGGSHQGLLLLYDGSYPGADATELVVSGQYKMQ